MRVGPELYFFLRIHGHCDLRHSFSCRPPNLNVFPFNDLTERFPAHGSSHSSRDGTHFSFISCFRAGGEKMAPHSVHLSVSLSIKIHFLTFCVGLI